MRTPLNFLLFILGVALSGSTLADPPDNYPFLSYDEGMRQAQAQHKPIFIYFGRFGCGYCEKTNVESFSNPALRERYIKNYVLVYIDAESGKRLRLPTGEPVTEAEMGARLNVFATPVFLYADMNGKILFRAPGFKTVEDFTAFDQYIQSGRYKSESINEFLSNK